MKRHVAKTAVVCGVAFQGPTMADAKAAGEAAITRLIGDHGPSLYRVHDLDVLIWPVLDGWCYKVLNDERPRNGTVWASCSYAAATRRLAEIEGVYAAAQRQWTVEVADDVAFFNDAYGSLAYDTAGSRSMGDNIEIARWQRRYVAAVNAGAGQTEAHEIASRTRTIEEAASQAGVRPAA